MRIFSELVMNHNNNTSSLFFLLLWFYSGMTYGQGVSSNSYRADEGLDTDIIKCIVQDSLGFVWIGSDDGLFRYDGISFERYAQAAPSKFFKDFALTTKYGLLVVHDMGITQIHSGLDTTSFTTFLSGARGMSDTTIWFPKKLFEDVHGNVWIAEPQSIVLYQEGAWKRFHFDAKDNTTSFVRSFNFFQKSDTELIIVSNVGNYYSYSYQSGDITPIPHSKQMVTYHIEHLNGAAYVATEFGLFTTNFQELPLTFDKITITGIDDQSVIRHITPVDDHHFVICGIGKNTALIEVEENNHQARRIVHSDMLVNQAYVGTDESIWLSTEKGVLLVSQPEFDKISLNGPNNYIEAIINSDQSDLCYALRKAEIWTINKHTEEAKPYYLAPNSYFLSGAMNGDTLIVSSGSSLLKLHDGKFLNTLEFSSYGRYIFDIVNDHQGHMWFSQETYTGLRLLDPVDMTYSSFGPNEGLPVEVTGIYMQDETVYAIASDPDHYLYVKPPQSEHFLELSIPFYTPYRSGLTIETIVVTDSTYWLGTSFGLFQLRHGKLDKVSISNSFDNSAVRNLKLEGKHLWIATTAGLIRYNTVTEDYAHFTESSGLPVNTINKECLIITDNRLWVGTSQGIAVSDYEQNSSFHQTKIPYFLSFTSNGMKIIPKDKREIVVPFEAYLAITYSSLVFPADDMQYSYRLDSEKWSNPQKQNLMTFRNLKPGLHTFQVKAKRMGNYSWSEHRSITFEVLPPFYQRPSFYLLVLLILAVAIMGTRYLTTRIEKRRQYLLKLLVSERTEELNGIKDQLEDLVKSRTIALEETVEQLTEAQDQLIQAEKMASLGVLTAGIAHEINNPVNYLKGGLYSLDKLLKEKQSNEQSDQHTEELNEVMGFMKLGIDRITNIVNGLGRYSRKSDHKIIPCNLHDILDNCLLIMEHEWKERIIIKTLMQAERYTINGDEGTLHQLFINLITNAIHAIPDEGEITIRTVNMDENSIQISIKDTGEGIPIKNKDKLFDPFYTTKAPGQGTGLGLFISKKIIEEHHGVIFFESQNAQGTTVFITFKLIDHATSE